MSSANAAPIWKRIAKTTLAWFWAIYILSAASVLVMTLHRHARIYRETLTRLSGDCEEEYSAHALDPAMMRELFSETAEEHGHGNVFLAIVSDKGETLVEESTNPGVSESMRAFAFEEGRTKRLTGEDNRGRSIAVRARRTPLPDGSILVVGINVTDNERLAFAIALVLAAALLLALAASLALSITLARKFTSPLSRISAAARDIASGNYSARVPLTQEGAEITELENAFNQMGAENERTLNELRRLTDDIAHDLRTPLGRLRAAAELAAFSGAPSLPETVIEETSGMLEMINTALAVTRAENLADPTPREELDMGAFLARLADLYSAPAEDRGMDFSLTLPDGPVFALAHKGKVQQLVGNLLDNAIKFTPEGGKISVRLEPGRLSVSNTGPGIDPADIPHIFGRFWRAERSRTLPGNGLGLALVKAIADSYGWRVKCSSSLAGPTEFTVEFAK